MLVGRAISGSYHEARPVFVEHRSVLLCAFGSQIQAVSVHTGALLGTFAGHTGLVSCMSNPNACAQSQRVVTSGGNASSGGGQVSPEDVVVSASLDGIVLVWNLVRILLSLRVEEGCLSFILTTHPPPTPSQDTYEELRRLSIGAPVFDLLVPRASASGPLGLGTSSLGHKGRGAEELLLVIGRQKRASASASASASSSSSSSGHQGRSGAAESFRLVLFDAAAGKTRVKLGKMRVPRQCCVPLDVDGEEIVVWANKARLSLWSVAARRGYEAQASTPSGAITCVAANSEKGLVVTGHERGEMLIWHNLPSWLRASASASASASGAGAGVAPPVTTSLHWHAHAVASLSLSDDGDYAQSVGEEGTLVLWQIKTGVKSFVPRLGAAATHVVAAKNSALVAVATMDNCLHVVDVGKMRQQWTVRSLCLPPSNDFSSSPSSPSSSSVAVLPVSLEDFLFLQGAAGGLRGPHPNLPAWTA